MQGDEIRLFQQLLQSDFLDTDLDGALCRQERVIGQHLHLQANRTVGRDRADITTADDAECLAGQLDTHEFRLFPFAGMGGFVGLRDLAGDREHHRNRMFRRGDGIAERGVHDHHTLGGGRFQVDVINADTGTADNLQIVGGFDQFCCRLGGGADGEAIILTDDFTNFCRGHAGLEIHFDATVAKDFDGARAQFVGDEYFYHFSNSSGRLVYIIGYRCCRPVEPGKQGFHVCRLNGRATPDPKTRRSITVGADVIGDPLVVQHGGNALGSRSLCCGRQAGEPVSHDLQADRGAGTGGRINSQKINPVCLFNPGGDSCKVGFRTGDQGLCAADFLSPFQRVQCVFNTEHGGCVDGLALEDTFDQLATLGPVRKFRAVQQPAG